MVVVVLATFPAVFASATAEDRPATRPEALAACIKGCRGRIEKQAGAVTPAQQATCEQSCGCIIDGMFEPGGKPKRDPGELGAATARCLARLPASSGEPAPAFAPAADGPPSIGWKGDVMTGRGCAKGKVPGLHYDDRQNTISLDGGGFVLRVPKDWHVASERPHLMVAWTAARSDGVRPAFEVFVTPKCKQADALMASARVAARALASIAPAEGTIEQVTKGKWDAGLGGPVGTSLILFDVGLKTAQGDRAMVLYSTSVASGKTFTIRAAAGCPRTVAKEQGLGPCEQTYFDMLKTAQ